MRCIAQFAAMETEGLCVARFDGTWYEKALRCELDQVGNHEGFGANPTTPKDNAI